MKDNCLMAINIIIVFLTFQIYFLYIFLIYIIYKNSTSICETLRNNLKLIDKIGLILKIILLLFCKLNKGYLSRIVYAVLGCYESCVHNLLYI